MSRVDLSVVLVTASDYRRLRKTIRHLAAQEIADRMQLIVVCPDGDGIEVPTTDREAFAELTLLETGPLRSTGEPRAQAVSMARAEVTVFAEDHCFPQPGWARALVEAHAAGHSAVGPVMINANPDTVLSWADVSLNFGPSVERRTSESSSLLCWHNTAYSTRLLLGQPDLTQLLEAEGVLLRRLERTGRSLFRTADARVAHINISSLRGFLLGHFWGTRLFWTTLIEVEEWSWARRLLFALASPALALKRLARGFSDLRRVAPAKTVPALPYLCLGSVTLTAGAVAGILFGPGNCMQHRLSLEFEREKHVAPGEEQLILV